MLVGELRECYRRSLEKVGGGGEQFFDSHNFNFPKAAILITFSFSFFSHFSGKRVEKWNILLRH